MSPDMTMCDDKECPRRKECYRFMATPDTYYQSYFVGTPRSEVDIKYGHSCLEWDGLWVTDEDPEFEVCKCWDGVEYWNKCGNFWRMT